MQHIHIGAGNFSLGFVAWLMHRAGLKPLILTRTPRGKNVKSTKLRNKVLKKNKSFKITYLDLCDGDISQDIEQVFISDLLFYDKPADMEKLFHIMSTSNDDIILTTSVKDKSAIGNVADLIIRIREDLPLDRKIYVIACENGFTTADVRASCVRLGKDVENIAFMDSVVDRICSQLDVVGTNGKQELVVEAERHASLVLEEKSGCDSLYSALNIDWVIKTPHIDVYRHVKLCVLNAAHVFLAGDALTFDEYVIPNFLNEEEIGSLEAPSVEQRRMHIRGILDELVTGLRASCVEEYDGNQEKLQLLEDLTSQSYLDEILDRFSRVDDDAERILSRLKSPTSEDLHTMSDFLRSMLGKIRPPVIGFIDINNYGPPLITRSFVRIADLVAEKRFAQRRTRH